MLRTEVIELAKLPWASPVVLVLKADGSWQFCVDYRFLNSISIRHTNPVSRMEKCINSLGNATVFTTLDANSGSWQVPVR